MQTIRIKILSHIYHVFKITFKSIFYIAMPCLKYSDLLSCKQDTYSANMLYSFYKPTLHNHKSSMFYLEWPFFLHLIVSISLNYRTRCYVVFVLWLVLLMNLNFLLSQILSVMPLKAGQFLLTLRNILSKQLCTQWIFVK